MTISEPTHTYEPSLITINVKTQYASWPCDTAEEAAAIQRDAWRRNDAREISDLECDSEMAVLGLRYATRRHRAEGQVA